MKRIAAALVAVLGATPVALAAVAVGLSERSILAAIGGGLTGALFFLPLTVWAVAVCPLVARPDTTVLSSLRGPGMIVLYLLLQLGCLVLAVPSLTSRPSVYPGVVRSDLRNLASQQEIHHQANGSYSESEAAIEFVTSDGVTVSLEATDVGWSAMGSHAASDEISCAIFYGQVGQPLPTNAGNVPTEPGEILCEPVLHLRSPGRLGDLLRAYYGALERGFAGVSLF